jgi:tRNA threonylcarbamoyladenosine biosynthesis protein TsaE
MTPRTPGTWAVREAPVGGPVPLDTPLELPEPADTEALGARLAAGLRAGDLVVLSGPLGAGKTALVRGLARGLGVAGPVTSPTFVIAREHRPLPGGAGVPLVHVDAYRLATAGEPADQGTAGEPADQGTAGEPADRGTAGGPAGPARAAEIAAQLDDLDLDTDLAEAVVAVEWGEGVVERLAARHVLVRLDRRPDDVRVARVHRVGPEAPGPVDPRPGRDPDQHPDRRGAAP